MLPSDVETVLLAWLRARPELDGYLFGTRRPASFADHLPYGRLTRAGGNASLPTWRPGPLLDRAGINLQVWTAGDAIDSRHACTLILSALYAMRSVTTGPLTVVRITPLSGLASLPDPDAPDAVHRATASVLVTTR